MWLMCHHCKQRNGFLIRGLCVQCAPDLHSQHMRRMDLIGEFDQMFKGATDKTALEDWHGFEQFLETQLPPEKQQAFIETFP